MDYKEEQQSELEALESIYPSEYNLLSDDPITFTISVQSENYEDGNNGLFCILKFTFTPTYPEEVPIVEIAEDEVDEGNMDPTDIIDLKELLVQLATENTGMAMVFTLVSAAVEWLNTRWETMVKEKEEVEDKLRREEEEAEQHRFDGTRVSVQSFIEWKISFDAEMASKRKEVVEFEKEVSSKKLTGRELFLRDKTLNESDLQFVEEGEDSVAIDESLFDDLDDLDLDAEDEDE